MIVLHQFARASGWDVPNLSPFCVKVETYLRMTGLPFEVRPALPPNGPKGKLPFIEDDGKRIGDSSLILEYLEQTYRSGLDEHLAPADRAVSHAMQRLIDEHLFWPFMYARWGNRDQNWRENRRALFGGLPPVIRQLVPVYARWTVLRQIWGQGTGRHSEAEIYRIGQQDLDALSDQLAEKPWFMGDQPSTLDGTAFGILANILWVPIESPLKEYLKSLSNLTAFLERMRERYYAG